MGNCEITEEYHMVYRKCDVHGWLDPPEYYVDENDELRCKMCDTVVHSEKPL